MKLVDTHCHLQFDKLSQNIGPVMKEAGAAGVTRMICVGTSTADSSEAVNFADRYDNVWAAVGAHPHTAKQFDYDVEPQKLEELAKQPRVAAFGEIGLDFYKNYAPRDIQEEMFRQLLEIALTAGLPVIFHVRDAWADFWRIVSDYGDVRAVVHSFSSGRKQADKILEKGWYIGLNGIMTFTKDEAQLEAARRVPLERLLLETDAPFLTPAPHRNEICEPKHAAVTADFLAKLRGEPLEELSRQTTINAEELFGLK